MSQGVYALGGKCPGGKCPGGKCPGGIFPWGKCPGGKCPGGLCPRTHSKPVTHMTITLKYRLANMYPISTNIDNWGKVLDTALHFGCI